ncbi:MAG: TonB-dependent receptor [Candidatus Marinimicrobia bacterium]|nr:TonB-dependent receptor [Candidatus Neomarinimicrobiota bacterium]MCF7827399.1 TonB-dependent receptor [Candidatus Neomarinimicrobiota bacterium]MCF7881368.1 TonB-dependent receptor [Candidatus Neomarinimicrobiota bacterium]
MKLLRLVFILFVGTVVFSTTYAQSTGRVAGKITDAETGEPIIGANVTISLDDGRTIGAATDTKGDYTILNVPIGSHDVKVTYIGYATVVKENVQVETDRIARVNFQLQTRAIAGEQVVVQADRDVLNKQVSSSQSISSAAEISEAAGVTTVEDFLSTQAGITGQENLNIRGGSAEQTGTIVNGLTFTNARVGKAQASIPTSAIQEVSVSPGGMDARYGNFRSGLINITTKSGTPDAFHGGIKIDYTPAQQKRFGKSLYHPYNNLLRPYFDPNVAFYWDEDLSSGGSVAKWLDDPMKRETYPQFYGYRLYKQIYNASVPEEEQVSEMDLYLWTAWMHMVEPKWDDLKSYADTTADFAFDIISEEEMASLTAAERDTNHSITRAQQKAIADHAARQREGAVPDYNIDFGFGGPVPVIGKALGGATFYFSHQTNNSAYVEPASRDAQLDHTSLLTLKSNITENMTLQLNGLYKLSKGALPTMPSNGSIPQLLEQGSGDADEAGGGGLMNENNLELIYDRGPDYYYHPTFWQPKDISYFMAGAKLNTVVNEKSYWDLTLNYAYQKDDVDFKVTRDPSMVTNFGPILINEMPFGRTPHQSDTVYTADGSDFYVHGPFGKPGGSAAITGSRRFQSKTGQYHENSVTQQFKGEFAYNNQVTNHHFLQTGMSMDYYDLNNDLWNYWKDHDTDYSLLFHRQPYQIGGYIQDQINFEEISAKVGMRADYYNSGGDVWPTGDRFNEFGAELKELGLDIPVAYLPGPEGDSDAMRYDILSSGRNITWERWREIDRYYEMSRDEMKNELPGVAPGTIDSLYDAFGGEENIDFLEPTKNYLVFSPRVGVSFPVTDRSKFYFNYGHYRATPPLSAMYMYTYRLSKGQGLNFIGNPNLEPPRTISYELGVAYNLLDQYLINLSGYYKDITGQETTIEYVGDASYDGWANNQYQDIQGVEVDIRKNVGDYLTGWANFRLLFQRTGYTGRTTWYQDDQLNQQPDDIYYQAEESQSNPQPSFRSNVTFHVPDNFGPAGPARLLLAGWDISGLFTWEQGDYFTWNPENLRNVNNNLQWPDYYMFDMRISKVFNVAGSRLRFYANVENLFNLKVNWMQRGWAFRSDSDRENYFNSLHLPIYDSPEYPEDTYTAGNDKPGDLRSEDKPYINDPNNALWLYGQPRTVHFGIDFSF